MPHDTGWRFLELGRRIERGQQLVLVMRRFLASAPGEAFSEFRLQTLLHFANSLSMFRTARPGMLRSDAVAGWLVLGEDNPRGMRYQAERISEHLESLPSESAPAAVTELRRLAFQLVCSVRLVDLTAFARPGPHVGEFLDEVSAELTALSDRITEVYFAHAERSAT
jgi:uncharacterized alpha-E superfamily protein